MSAELSPLAAVASVTPVACLWSVCASPPPAGVHSVKQKTEHNDVTWQSAAVLLHSCERRAARSIQR